MSDQTPDTVYRTGQGGGARIAGGYDELKQGTTGQRQPDIVKQEDVTLITVKITQKRNNDARTFRNMPKKQTIL